MRLAIIEGGHIDIDRHKLLSLEPGQGTVDVDVAAQQLINTGWWHSSGFGPPQPPLGPSVEQRTDRRERLR